MSGKPKGSTKTFASRWRLPIITVVALIILALATPFISALVLYGGEAIGNNMPLQPSIGSTSQVNISNKYVSQVSRLHAPVGFGPASYKAACSANCARSDATMRAQVVTQGTADAQVCGAAVVWGEKRGVSRYLNNNQIGFSKVNKSNTESAVARCVDFMHAEWNPTGSHGTKDYSAVFSLIGQVKSQGHLLPIRLTLQRSNNLAPAANGNLRHLYKLEFGTNFAGVSD